MTGGNDERDQSTAPAANETEGVPTEPGPVVITGSQVTGLHATTATISQSRIESLTSQRTDLNQAFAQRIETKLAQLDGATAVRIETDRLVAEDSRAVGIIAGQARFVRSRVGFVISRQVEVGTNSRILVHIGSLRSDVTPSVSSRTAVAFGAGLGAAVMVGIGLLGRRR